MTEIEPHIWNMRNKDLLEFMDRLENIDEMDLAEMYLLMDCYDTIFERNADTPSLPENWQIEGKRTLLQQEIDESEECN